MLQLLLLLDAPHDSSGSAFRAFPAPLPISSSSPTSSSVSSDMLATCSSSGLKSLEEDDAAPCCSSRSAKLRESSSREGVTSEGKEQGEREEDNS